MLDWDKPVVLWTIQAYSTHGASPNLSVAVLKYAIYTAFVQSIQHIIFFDVSSGSL